jgi:hypothetical protein
MSGLEEKKVEEDQKKRAEAEIVTSNARVENGAEKERILAESKAAEVIHRVEEVKGSEWNTGSYFWEER